jgi:hypothetical protein
MLGEVVNLAQLVGALEDITVKKGIERLKSYSQFLLDLKDDRENHSPVSQGSTTQTQENEFLADYSWIKKYLMLRLLRGAEDQPADPTPLVPIER